jgi:hypothetical protein
MRNFISAFSSLRTLFAYNQKGEHHHHLPMETRVTTRRESFILFGFALAIMLALAILLTVFFS